MKELQTVAEQNTRSPAAGEDFSLALGGPLYHMLLKTRLARPPLLLLHRRLLVIPALAWLPLLALTLAEGRAVSGVAIPFLHDVEAYARFLVALPILVMAEVILHQCLGDVIAQFRKRRMVPPEVAPRFSAAIASAMRLRDSNTPEMVMLAMVLVVAPLAWHYAPALPASTWYADVADSRVALTRAGWWFVHASVPLSQFLLLRLYFRLLIWGRLLWQVARLPLNLTPAHPDRSGGLGFLEESVPGFLPVVLAQATIASGFIASRVMFDGRNVLDFRMDIAMLVVALLVLTLLPLCFLAPRLVATRWTALEAYGALATSYVRGFERKWFSGQPPKDDELLGSADIQSLNDLAGSYEIVNGMRLVPFGIRTVIQVLAAALVPFLPLLFTVFSLRELLGRLAKMLL